MQRYSNRYIDAEQLNGFIADPRRVLLGMFVAPAVGALATEVPTFTFQSYWGVALLGWLSVITLYLPLVLSRQIGRRDTLDADIGNRAGASARLRSGGGRRAADGRSGMDRLSSCRDISLGCDRGCRVLALRRVAGGRMGKAGRD